MTTAPPAGPVESAASHSSARPGRCPSASWQFTGTVFVRLLACVYAVAFLSLRVQVDGLVGENGILPASRYLEAVREYATASHVSPLRLAPTVCYWIGNGSNRSLHALCDAGIVLSLLGIAGVLPGLTMLLLWLLYLSLTGIGQTFLGFQWENLLLETGLIAVFVAPCAPWLSGRPRAPATGGAARALALGEEGLPRTLARILLVWLLVRLMLQSGLVKLASNDDVWWNLTALQYHYWTQPLPPWTAYYMHQLPAWLQAVSVAIVYVIECGLPFCMFGPRRLRLVAFWGTTFLMLMISLTGNYTYFNLLTVVVAFALLDDHAWPARLRNRLVARPPRPAIAPRSRPAWIAHAVIATAVALAGIVFTLNALYLSTGYLGATIGRFTAVLNSRNGWSLPVTGSPSAWWQHRAAWWAPCRSVNSYGLFANMTESRPEIIIEGSHDGRTWEPYTFRYKPGRLDRRPRFVQPHQPRLDWQMWFAALGSLRGNPWVLGLMEHLLRGTPDVLALLGPDPFPGAPPRYLRAVVYDYTFTTPAEKKLSGNWWRRENPRPYTPVLTLRDGELVAHAPDARRQL